VLFHKLIKFGGTDLFDQHVKAPMTEEETIKQQHEYTMAGLPGAIGSIDATYITLEKAKYKLRQAHLVKRLTY
jgi:hypothetical protein